MKKNDLKKGSPTTILNRTNYSNVVNNITLNEIINSPQAIINKLSKEEMIEAFLVALEKIKKENEREEIEKRITATLEYDDLIKKISIESVKKILAGHDFSPMLRKSQRFIRISESLEKEICKNAEYGYIRNSHMLHDYKYKKEEHLIKKYPTTKENQDKSIKKEIYYSITCLLNDNLERIIPHLAYERVKSINNIEKNVIRNVLKYSDPINNKSENYTVNNLEYKIKNSINSLFNNLDEKDFSIRAVEIKDKGEKIKRPFLARVSINQEEINQKTISEKIKNKLRLRNSIKKILGLSSIKRIIPYFAEISLVVLFFYVGYIIYQVFVPLCR